LLSNYTAQTEQIQHSATMITMG